MPASPVPQLPPVASTGIEGLDALLSGGLPLEDMHMVQGTAGTGKTTLCLHFLLEGVRNGEAVLYVTLAQSKMHLERVARSHGWTLDGILVHELSAAAVADRIAVKQTVLPTVEVELDELFRELEEQVRTLRPKRAVIDSVGVLQLVAGNAARYHREVVALRHLFVEQGCTLLAIADHPAAESQNGQTSEVIFHPLCGTVIDLARRDRPYGDARRLLRVIKSRAMPVQGGIHDFKVVSGGLEVFPRLNAHDQPEHYGFKPLPTGVAELDHVLGGGLEEGTACLIVGPSGVGKSTLGSLAVASAAGRGENAAVYLFDERPELYKARADGVGIPLRPHVESGRVRLRQMDPARITPGEFAQSVRRDLDEHHARVIVIDSVSGYFNAVGSGELFIAQLHELLTFLSRRGVLTIMAGSQHGFMSIGAHPGVDISYLSDTVLALAYYEADGEVHRCLTAVKRRNGEHETSIRELLIGPNGVHLGPPLRQYRNLLLANPRPAPPTGGGDEKR